MKSEQIDQTSVTAGKVDCGCLWFCVQTHPKHEHIAAGALIKNVGLEVFNPQLKTRRATRRGPVWFIESVFPGYIFACFDLQHQLDRVRYSASVSRIVNFKSGYPSIPDHQIGELRRIIETERAIALSAAVSPGDRVRIVGGAFHDLVAVVQQVRSAQERVKVLLEFLGRQTAVEINVHSLVIEERAEPLSHPLVNLKLRTGSGRPASR